MQSPLSALERMMLSPSDAMDMDGGRLPDEDPDATPPGRAAVSYATAGDSLFSPPAPQADADAAGGGDLLADGLMGLLGDPSGALGSGGLVAQLEAMAEDFERQTGEPETEIRAKIAMLRGVLDARPGVVAQSRSRMDAAVAVLDAEQQHESPQAAAAAAASGAGDAALHSVCSSTVDSIEGELGRVEATLNADPEAAALVSTLLGAGSKP